MLISEIRDAFIVKLKLECLKRKVDYPELNNKVIAFLISEAQQDIQSKLDVITGSKTYTLVAGANAYNCPNDFGKLKWAMLGDYPLDVVSDYQILNYSFFEGSPIQIAQYVNGNTPQILIYPTPTDGTETFTIYYSVDTLYYQPSGVTDQGWGDFDGTTFSNKLLLPDKYNKAVQLYLLAQIFDDFNAKYQDELLSLRGNQSASMPLRLDYELGHPRKRNYLINGLTGTTGNTNLTYQVMIAQSGTSDPVVINTFQNGFTGTPVISRVSEGIYTIVLSGVFTENKTFLHKPNIDKAAVGDESDAELEWVDSSTIRLKVYDSVNDLTDGFNAIYLKIEVEP